MRRKPCAGEDLVVALQPAKGHQRRQQHDEGDEEADDLRQSEQSVEAEASEPAVALADDVDAVRQQVEQLEQGGEADQQQQKLGEEDPQNVTAERVVRRETTCSFRRLAPAAAREQAAEPTHGCC